MCIYQLSVKMLSICRLSVTFSAICQLTVKAGDNMKAVSWLGIMVLANISFTFQAVKNISAHPT